MEKLYKASDIIRAIDKHTKDTPHWLVLDEDITIILEEMKSVEPDASDCWGCNCPKMERKTFSEMVHLHDAETHDKRTETHGVYLDTISRQEAIDEAFEVYLDGERFEVVQVETLMGLPSATCRNLEKPEKPQHSEGEAADCNLDCIGRQAAIEAVRKCSVKEVTPAFMLVDKAEVMTELMMLPSAQPEQRWIPCSERLPEKERRTYWVCTDAETQHECRWTNNRFGMTELDEWGWSIFDTPQYTKVIAWIPLPEPWKGEEHE